MRYLLCHMDPVSQKLLIHGSETLSPILSPGNSATFHPHLPHSSSASSFPIIAIAVIGILASAFLLVGYYLFVIKCCLNWDHIDLLTHFSPSRRRENPLASYSPRTQPRGLGDALIRLIPVVLYKSERHFSIECSVCLNEFQEEEKLRIIPTCSHVFHIDCIDVWLQNNANCPLCRTIISISMINQILSVPQGGRQDNEEDSVVIQLGTARESSIMEKEARRLKKVTSMGDECIENRAKDEQFSVIRRSVSMNSYGDRRFCLAVQEALKKENRQASFIEGSSSSNGGGRNRVKRSSFFSFGHSRSRSAVLPVFLDS